MEDPASTRPERDARHERRPGCLDLDNFNAIIVGSGALGTALLEKLLAREGLRRAVVLCRDVKSGNHEAKVTRVRFDAEDAESVASAASEVHDIIDRAHLLINTVGMLHRGEQQPEKRLRDVDPADLQRSFAVNAALLPLLAQGLGGLLRHREPAVLASLSARVGSIEDNQLGGWYSYRASKAAHNMLLKTLSREWRVSHRNVTVVALHPGTVRSRLSEPFLSPGYKNRILSPGESAGSLLKVIADLHPEDSGRFYDWQGQPVPW